MRKLIADTEGNGLLKQLTRMHCLVLRDVDTNEVMSFRNTDELGDGLPEGLDVLCQADMIVGHNLVSYDLKAIKKLYPQFVLPQRVIVKDTLIMGKIAFPDIKEVDFKLWRAGTMPSELVGKHSLKAWGYRLGKHKGDYDAEMRAKGLDPWASWNQDLEDYCVLDTEVCLKIYEECLTKKIPDECSALEHAAFKLASKIQENGFPFDRAAALVLASQLENEVELLRSEIVSAVGRRFVPDKKKQIAAYYYDPAGVNRKKELSQAYDRPEAFYGEDKSRKWWGEVVVPKRTAKRSVGDMSFQYTEGVPYCKAKWVDFNPGSRDQIAAYLIEDCGWQPDTFTEGGKPSVDAEALEVLGETLPLAKKIGEYLFVTKLFSQVQGGPQSWLKNYNEETGAIHGHTDTGGAVTGRSTHSKPNLGQVPAVVSKKLKDILETNKDILDQPEYRAPEFRNWYDLKKRKDLPLLGRVGEFGWESRSLFRVPEGWKQVGVDLKGIELRCLAALCSEFDGGELMRAVLDGDPHAYNQEKTGIPTRDIMKRVLYGLLYGAGDLKLGLTAKPTATLEEAVIIGKAVRAQLMAGLPALAEAIKKVKLEAKRGYLIGLDKRRILVRSEHSALNTRLQSDAALIAKRWIIETEWAALETGAYHGWTDDYGGPGDFAMLAFVHDELQTATHPLFAEEFAKLCEESAVSAGQYFNYPCPVEADSKVGYNWAQCH